MYTSSCVILWNYTNGWNPRAQGHRCLQAQVHPRQGLGTVWSVCQSPVFIWHISHSWASRPEGWTRDFYLVNCGTGHEQRNRARYLRKTQKSIRETRLMRATCAQKNYHVRPDAEISSWLLKTTSHLALGLQLWFIWDSKKVREKSPIPWSNSTFSRLQSPRPWRPASSKAHRTSCGSILAR